MPLKLTAPTKQWTLSLKLTTMAKTEIDAAVTESGNSQRQLDLP